MPSGVGLPCFRCDYMPVRVSKPVVSHRLLISATKSWKWRLVSNWTGRDIYAEDHNSLVLTSCRGSFSYNIHPRIRHMSLLGNFVSKRRSLVLCPIRSSVVRTWSLCRIHLDISPELVGAAELIDAAVMGRGAPDGVPVDDCVSSSLNNGEASAPTDCPWLAGSAPREAEDVTRRPWCTASENLGGREGELMRLWDPERRPWHARFDL